MELLDEAYDEFPDFDTLKIDNGPKLNIVKLEGY